ncbi:myc box-dependent-interacting protein 1b isoform X12 [Sander lucioperca]|uniref:myc box-dependent-interacting protein 1b isoform X12 n=1 Tax=Sander lucioperca TaxID=283035 RepID=UPI0016539262|nr:myc box-dependent-interacting protein 1b isoform X12 [Sander lucioperca]
MAEMGKGVTAGKLASNVQKRLTRAQEKVLQKLGKADETRDAAFEEMVANFNKQMTEGTKLQKDMKAYLVAVKTMHDASRRLQDCLAEMYEPDWFGKEEMDTLIEEMIEKEMDNNLEDTDTLWLDYHQNIMDKSMTTLDSYLTQFPDIKARIAKRDRKMVDFDSARHHFSSLQKGKKKDEAKIAKQAALLEMAAPSWAQGLISAHQVAQTNLSFNQAEEELGRAQKIFEELNVELQDELPALFDNRVGIYVNSFQSLAGHQEKFHGEMSKLSQNLNDIMTKLEEQRELNEETNHSESASSPPKRPDPPPSRPPPRLPPSQHVGPTEDKASVPDAHTDSSSTTTTEQVPSLDSWQQQTAAEQEPQHDVDQHPEQAPGGWDYDEHSTQSSTQPSWDDAETAQRQESWGSDGVYAAQSYTEPNWDDDGSRVGQGGWGDDGEVQSAVTNGSDDKLPPGFLYKVKAIHEYAATDADELELKIGDVVLVLAFDNPDEQDDGWLLGVQESHWLQNKDISVKGVFPENFTQKV